MATNSPVQQSSISVPGQPEQAEVILRQSLWRGTLVSRRYTVASVQQAYMLLDQGSDKLVIKAAHLGERKVAYAPVRKWGGIYSRESALRQEYRKIQAIRNLVHDATHLALDMAPLNGDDRIDNHFSLVVAEARGNLEKEICTRQPSFATRLGYCRQYLDGLMNLHRLGMAHGDIKPENCLVYDNGLLKIADFGKTDTASGSVGKMYKGNLRFCPPEGVLSIKGDIYGSALLIIRVLEETDGILDDQGQLLPIPAKEREPGVSSKGRGVEKYVVEHRQFLALDSQRLGGKIARQLPRQIKLIHLSSQRRTAQQRLMSRYIDALCNKLVGQAHLSAGAAEQLATLLKEMMADNPAKRITAAEALKRLTTIEQGVTGQW